MGKQKIHFKTIVLLALIVLFVVSIFYLSLQLRNESGATGGSPIQRVKTKAAAKSYTKIVALNNVSPSPSLVPSLSPSPSLVLSPTDSSPLSLTPSPTDIIIAENNISPTENNEDSAGGTVLPTKERISTLPETGYTGYSLAIFGGALTMILLAFVL